MMKKEPFDPTEDKDEVSKYSNLTKRELINLNIKLGLFGSPESVREFTDALNAAQRKLLEDALKNPGQPESPQKKS